jgi:hypothetical protein
MLLLYAIHDWIGVPMHSQIVSIIREAIAEWRRDNSGCCTILLIGFVRKTKLTTAQDLLTIVQDLCADITAKVLFCDAHVSQQILKIIGSDCIVTWSEGLQRADLMVYLCKNNNIRFLDKKDMYDKKNFDFYDLDIPEHVPSNSQATFWPASSVLDFFIVNQTDRRFIRPPKKYRE